MKKRQTKDVKSTEKYMENVEETLLRHRVFERIESLSEKLNRQQGINNEDILEYEKIDRDVFRLCRGAEKNVLV